MNRRGFLQSLIAAPVVAAELKATSAQTAQRATVYYPATSYIAYGSMNADRWYTEGHFGKRVLCDGVDITDRCLWFDDTTGEAECCVYEPGDGPFKVEVMDPERPGQILTEVLRGDIRVVERQAEEIVCDDSLE